MVCSLIPVHLTSSDDIDHHNLYSGSTFIQEYLLENLHLACDRKAKLFATLDIEIHFFQKLIFFSLAFVALLVCSIMFTVLTFQNDEVLEQVDVYEYYLASAVSKQTYWFKLQHIFFVYLVLWFDQRIPLPGAHCLPVRKVSQANELGTTESAP